MKPPRKPLWVLGDTHKTVLVLKAEKELKTVDDAVQALIKSKCKKCGTTVIGGQHQ